MNPIAIVGISCLFPDAPDPQTFWENLLAGHRAIDSGHKVDWIVDPATIFDPRQGTPDKIYSLEGGWIRGFNFDSNGYSISPEQLSKLDRMYKWPIAAARAAIADYAGETRTLSRRCGVVVGSYAWIVTPATEQLVQPIYDAALEAAFEETGGRLNLPRPAGSAPDFADAQSGFVASLVARALGLSGPSYTIDAACASSLYSFKLAALHLNRGQADVMLAGAVSGSHPVFTGQGFSTLQALPPDGPSRPLDASSNGLAQSNGACMFVLKRLDDAVRDGDRIYATIRGIGLSNDGHGKHLVTPSQSGQMLALERAFSEAGIARGDLGYLECHATGTKLGDRTELASIEAFFGDVPPLIGAVKSNVGHLLTAAGGAGAIKVIESMRTGIIPATIGVTDPLRTERDILTPDRMVLSNTAWPAGEQRRFGAVNSFGFGGTNAHMILEEAPRSSDPIQTNNDQVEKISTAIVGMDALFGDFHGLDQLSTALYSGKSGFRKLPKERWHGLNTDETLLLDYGFGSGKAPRGAYIENFEVDALRLGIAPNELDRINPQHVLLLHVADRALQDSKVTKGSRVAVVVGMANELSIHRLHGRWQIGWRLEESAIDAGSTTGKNQELEQALRDDLHHQTEAGVFLGYVGNLMASRIANLWDFNGPAFTLSSEENSAYHGLDVARMFLESGEADAVVLAGVDLSGGVENVLLRNRETPVDNRPGKLAFDREAHGWSVGEGAAAVVLKRTADAERDGDRIYAVIEGCAITQSGSDSSGLSDAVKEAATAAIAEAGIDAVSIGYVELSSPGQTSLAEAELAGLSAAYASAPQDGCALGSIKSQIGETFAASGLASLVRAALCVSQRYLPATPVWTGVAAQPDASPFNVASEARPWFSQNLRRAAVSGVGADGAAFSIIVAEPAKTTSAPASEIATDAPYIIPIMSADLTGLEFGLDRCIEQLERGIGVAEMSRDNLRGLAQAKSVNLTLSLVGSNAGEIKDEIEQAKTALAGMRIEGDARIWKTPRGSYFAADPLGPDAGIALVYPGIGTAYLDAGRELFQIYPGLHETLAASYADPGSAIAERTLYPRSFEPITPRMRERLEEDLLSSPEAMINAGNLFSVAYTKLLTDGLGIQPACALGFSLGEISMMFGSGAWPLGEEWKRRFGDSAVVNTELGGSMDAVRRAWSIGDEAVDWASFTLLDEQDAVRQAIPTEGRVYLSHICRPGHVIISGTEAACQEVIERLGCQAVRGSGMLAIHCEPVNAVKPQLEELFRVESAPGSWPCFFAGNESAVRADEVDVAATIAAGLCSPIDFTTLVRRVYDSGPKIFIEVGLGTTCSRWIEAILEGKPHVALSTNARGAGDRATTARLLAALVSHRAAMDLQPWVDSIHVKEVPARRLIRTITLGGPPIGRHVRALATVPRQTPAHIDTNGHAPAAPHTTGYPEISAPIRITRSAPEEVLSASEQSGIQQVAAVTRLDHAETAAPVHAGAGATRILGDLAQLARASSAIHAQVLNRRNRNLAALAELEGLARTADQNTIGALHSNGFATQLPSQGDPHKLAANTPHFAASAATPPPPARYSAAGRSNAVKPLLNEADVIEFAEGKLAHVLGPDYAEVDNMTRRVRIPGPPFTALSRVISIEGKARSLEPGRIVTEFDVPSPSWYAVDGQVPYLAMDAQGVLILASHLGVDFANQGRRVFRWLDATIQYMSPLPREGDTIRYEITIDAFKESQDALIFFSTYDCYVGDRQILRIDNCCTGFFTFEGLANGNGITAAHRTKRALAGHTFTPPLRSNRRSLTHDDLMALHRGDIAACFGPSYNQHGLNPSLRLPPAPVQMVDRVVEIDPAGGVCGLGKVVAEKDLSPLDWYIRSHFKDDPVFAGPCIVEGSLQILQTYAMFCGLQTGTRNARFQPMPGRQTVVRFRAQVPGDARRFTYHVDITEIGMSPAPYLVADIEFTCEGRNVGRFENMAVMLLDSDDHIHGTHINGARK